MEKENSSKKTVNEMISLIVLPAANYLVSTDLKRNLYNTKNLKGKMKEVYDLRECIQYKFFIK